MDGATGRDGDASAAVDSADRGQLLLVGCCLVAVFAAALLAPPPVDPGVPGGSDGGTPTPSADADGGVRDDGGGAGDADGRTGESGGTGDGGASDVAGGDGEPIPLPGDEVPTTAGCGVLLEDRPVPGARVTVGVFEAGDPLSAVPVRFNGEPVGSTDENGRVSGQVPYDRTLAVTVDVDSDCEFYRERFDADDSVESDLGSAMDPGPTTGPGIAGRPPGLARQPVSARDRRTAGPDRPASAVAGTLAAVPGRSVVAGALTSGTAGSGGAGALGGAGPRTLGSGNETGQYAVVGDVNLTVEGDPYPGSTVTVTATVEGVPMREAGVEVDGGPTARTDANGTAALSLPEGQQTVTVTAARGDFAGETTVDVLLLTASVRPDEGLPVPGERATVAVAIDEEPADGVPVRVGDRRLGETASDGTVPAVLPVGTGATVVASTERQTARVPLWQVYLPTVGNLLVVLGLGVVSVVGARLLGGETATARVAVAWSCFAVADGALLVGEWPGLALALGGTALVGTVYYRRELRAGGGRATGLLAWAVGLARRAALGVVDGLERLADGVVALLGRVRANLTSFETVVAWVDAVVRQAATTVTVYLTLRRAGVALFVAAELAVATARWGDAGLVASAGGLSVLALLVALWRREDLTPGPGTDDGGTEGSDAAFRASGRADASDSAERALSVRELWRRFAGWVVPGAWRTKTPGEVARAAVDRGFPRGPVEALTDAFRDVEYGNEPPTERRERARAAFDRLARARREDDE